MPQELIISISGMRGIIGGNLNAAVAAEYGVAFGTFLKRNSDDSKKLTVAIGMDSRPSGVMLKSAVTAGLCSAGIDVVDLGIVSTPGVGIMLRYLKCAGGVVITASHNPIEYNGIKLLLANGIAPLPDMAEQIKRLYLEKNIDFAGAVDCGKIVNNKNCDKIHIEKVLQLVDKKAIAAKKFKVVLDSVNGAGGRVGVKLLEEMGCEVIAMNVAPTGIFAHTPEPTAENLTDICSRVKAESSDIGFAQDPDADRLAIIDENGTYIGEEYSLALAGKYIFTHKKGPAATNLSTSRMIDDIANEAGCSVIRTAVGEANVAGTMIENNCVIGGEGNGGVIDLRVGPIRDSLVGIAFILQLMTQSNKTISELVAEIGAYHMIKKKYAADKETAVKIIERAKKLFADARIDTTDGCRFDFDNGWLHLRTSNTEPVMRLIVEAKDEATAQGYIDKIENISKNITL
ncbi:MAG: phosphoglucosamine mutase [Planctomycetes bacterium]|nr:phosphoglucosamine mutase [Planctomycetota bacterium]